MVLGPGRDRRGRCRNPLRRYVLLEQTRPDAAVFARPSGSGALQSEPPAPQDRLALPELGLELDLTEIYAGLAPG